jgi:hypothetical protein
MIEEVLEIEETRRAIYPGIFSVNLPQSDSSVYPIFSCEIMGIHSE